MKKLVILMFIMSILAGCSVLNEKEVERSLAQTINDRIYDRINMNKEILPFSENTKIVGIISKYSGDPFLDEVVSTASKTLKEQGIFVVSKSPNSPYDSTLSQKVILEEFIISGVDGIILIPSDDKALNETIKLGIDQGIHFVIPDTLIDLEHANQISLDLSNISFVIIDNYKDFNAVLDMYFKTLIGNYNAIALVGERGNPNAIHRERAIIDAIANNININYIKSLDCKWQENIAYELVGNALSEDPSINMIIASNDRMALGAIEYLDENNLKNIIVTGFDGTEKAIEAIKSGELKLTVTQNPPDFGEISAEVMVNKINLNPTERYYYVPTRVIFGFEGE